MPQYIIQMELKAGEYLRLPEAMRGELSAPFDNVIKSEDTEKALLKTNDAITVGDAVTASFLKLGKEPYLAIFDLKTKRREYIEPIITEHYKSGKTVKNPAGQITFELWSAIAYAVKDSKIRSILVDGEEDLATLPCIQLSPVGMNVIYGIPDVGIAIVKVNKETKRIANDILGRMERISNK